MTCSPSYCVATEALANVAKHGARLSLLADPQRATITTPATTSSAQPAITMMSISTAGK